jgi:hypothetical protein
MKRACCLLIVFLSAITSRAQTQNVEKVYLVEVTELTQEKTNEIVTVEAYQSLLAEMTVKNQLLPKAVELATKEWKEKHSDLGPFPQQTALTGAVKSLGMFNDKAKATQALKDLLGREEKDRKKKLSSAEKQLEMLQTQLKAYNSNAAQNQTQIYNLQTQIKSVEAEIARKKKKDEDKNANLTAAREIFNSKLKQLLAENKTIKP